MKIIVLGASGMLGSYLVKFLRQNGHTVIGAARTSTEFKLDLCNLPSAAQLLEKFEGADCVCNCIGIAPGFGSEKQFLIHYHAIKKVLEAAKQAQIKKIIHISALSNAKGDDLNIPYLASKHKLDKELLADSQTSSFQTSIVIRPSLIYAPTGASSIAFLRMARLTWMGLPQKGKMLIAPLHVIDLCDFIHELIIHASKNKIYEIGGIPLSLASYINGLKPNPKRKIFAVPDLMSRIGMLLLHQINPGIGGLDAYRLLLAGSAPLHNEFEAILKREPIKVHDFLETDRNLRIKEETHLC